MSRSALRFSSVNDMPQGMREMVARQTIRPEFPTRPAGEPRQKNRHGQPEHDAQVAFINAIRELAKIDRRYALAVRRTYAIPNGGHRGKATAGRMKAEGQLAGVSDLETALPVPGYHGLYIEMKAPGNYPSKDQRAWLNESHDLGYAAHCCTGAAEAFAVWKAYVERGF